MPLYNLVIAAERGADSSIKYVHIWSDGCAGQLKNKHQLFWLTDHQDYKVCHNFFQSCHGKGPSDSEGAVVKSYLRRQAFLYDKRANTSKEAFEMCDSADSNLHQPTVKEDLKQRHTIMSRCFKFVELGKCLMFTSSSIYTTFTNCLLSELLSAHAHSHISY